MKDSLNPAIVTDVQVKPGRPIPRFFKDFSEIHDHEYGIEITRACVTRGGKGWKDKMTFLGEILIGLDNLRRRENNLYYHLNASALVQLIQTIMNTCNGFHFDRDVQSIVHNIHAQPYWRKGDRKRRIVGYAITHTVKLIKGGHFNTFEFPGAEWENADGSKVEVKERDLIINRYELIDCRRLHADEHAGAGMVVLSPDGKLLSLMAVVVDPKTKEKTTQVAGVLEVKL